jgi:hypothetical protein
MAKTIKKHIKPETKQKPEIFKDLLENNWVSIVVLFIFWLIFFRQLITGTAFIGDDFIEQFYPTKSLLAVSLSKGFIPFWNPYTFSGMPFFADLQIAVFYPTNYLLSFFVNGEYLAPVVIQFSIVLHYLICSIFCFYIGRHFKLTNTASVIFALMFTYSSYMIIHILHMALLESVIWLPIVFLLWLKFIDSRKYIFVFIASLLMTFCVIAGYPQVSFYNYLFVSIYILIIFIIKIREKDYTMVKSLVIGYVIFLIFSFGLSAFQIIPANEFVSLSNRSKITYDFAIEGSIEPRFFLSFFIPKLFGVWKFNDISGDISWWATKDSFMFSINNYYVSILVVVLLVPVLMNQIKNKIDKPITWFLIGVSVFCLLYSFGGYFFFHKIIFYTIPFFNRFRNPGHILYIFSFCITLLIAFGLDTLLRNRKVFGEVYNKKYFIILLSLFGLILILVYSGAFNVNVQQASEKINEWIKSQYLLFFVFLAATSSLIYFYINDKIKLNTFIVSLLLISMLDLYITWHEQNNGSIDPEVAYNQHKQQEDTFKNELKNEFFRVNMREPGMIYLKRNSGMVSRIPLLEGYGALVLDRYHPVNKNEPGSSQAHDIMNVKYKLDPATLKSGNPANVKFYVNQTYLPRARMFYDVKYFEDKDSVEIRNYMAGKEFDHHKTIIIESNKKDYALPVLNDSIEPKSEVKITNYDLNSITIDVETSENGFLFLSEVYYPAWKAYIDEKNTELFRADYSERAVYVAKGKHTILFNYESDTFKTGLTITLPLLFIWLLATIFLTYRYNKNKKFVIQNKDK